VVGIILSNLGTLRLFRDPDGRLSVEVVGFDTDEGRAFVEELGGQLEDITDEFLAHEHPESLMPHPLEFPRRFWRRRS
jgi:hypothetical protein